VAFGVYIFGGTDQYPCVFAHVLHPTRPPIAVPAIICFALALLSFS
jgi:hypothetical protein